MADLRAFLEQGLREAAAAAAALADPGLQADLAAAVGLVSEAFDRDGRLLVFGNGGSAGDASHLAGEFVGRCVTDRRALPAIALADSAATVTALANDYGYEQVFARQVEAFGRPGDVALAMSTSGRSPNVLRGLEAARGRGMATIAMTGAGGRALAPLCDVLLVAPTTATPRIQECHQVWGHLMAEWVDASLRP